MLSSQPLDAVPLPLQLLGPSPFHDFPLTANICSFTSLKQKATASALVLLTSNPHCVASLFTYIHRVAYYNKRDLSDLK